MLRIVCLDDEFTHKDILAGLTRRAIAQVHMEAKVVLCTQRAEEVLFYARIPGGQTLYMLDIELNQSINGMGLTEQLHKIDPAGYIVYVSAHQHYAMHCLHTHAFDFLLKPLTLEAVAACLDAIQKDLNRRSVHILPIRLGSQTVLIDQEDILYICSQRNCVRAVTMKGSHTWRCTLDAVAKQLVSEWFVRIHRQTLCAISYIADIDWGEGVVNMKNGDRLVLSRRLAPQLREMLSETVGIHR